MHKAFADHHALVSGSYDAGSKTLTVAFKNGSYSYADVPAEKAQAFFDDEHALTYLSKEIKPNHEATKL